MSTKRIINYISLRNGRCGLTADSVRETLRRLGTDNVEFIRPATAKDVEWVRGMGGDVPEGRIAVDNRAIVRAAAAISEGEPK